MLNCQRPNVVASNLANADSVTSLNGQAYKVVVFRWQPKSSDPSATGGRLVIVEDAAPKLMHDPKNRLQRRAAVATPT